tara:strand:- start:1327 stop:1800 length:474 start_codon:yes stop_codon:yes gene_type:complete
VDPASLALLAGSAFKGIQTVVQAGGEIEHVTQKLGQWFTLASDFQDKMKQIENPPLYKRVFDGGSVEQAALDIVVSQKKFAEQEKQIRELITWAYGPETYREMMQLRKDIKARREKMIYKRRKRQQKMLDISFMILGAIITGGIIFATYSIIQGAKP